MCVVSYISFPSFLYLFFIGKLPLRFKLHYLSYFNCMYGIPFLLQVSYQNENLLQRTSSR